MTDVSIDLPTGGLPAYLAEPTENNGPWPGVIVVHDALGMTSDLRNQADWLAGHGYLAVAPDLYHWGRRLRCLIPTMRAMATGTGRSFDDLDATRRWLHARDDCTGRIGVIGFCMGGGYALMLAGSGDYQASSVNYGMIDDAEQVLADSCPIVASYGAKDRSLRAAPGELDRILTTHGVEHDIKTYRDAGHGFLNDHGPGETPIWAAVAGRFANTAHHEPSAIDARQRIIAFFDRHLC